VGSSVILPPPGQPKQGPDPTFKTTSNPNQVSFQFTGVGPPSPLYVQRDDILLLEAATAGADTVIFNIRFLLAPFTQGGQPASKSGDVSAGTVVTTGVIQPMTQVINITAAQKNTLQSVQLVLSEGYLLAIGAIASVTNARGVTFARAVLIRGSASFVGGNTFQSLFADYTTVTAPIGWPAGRFLHPTEGTGFMHRINQANPGAGTDFIFQATSAQRWRVQSLVATLTTSVTVANRQVHALVQDSGGTTYWNSAAVAVQAASTTVVYTFGPGLTPQTTTDGVQVVTLPANLILAQTDQIKSATTNIQAGDQWSLINMSVEQWLDLV
jgi:hypothetical protein